jgi:hypothetical protein
MAEALLQGMIERLIKIGRIETNVEKKLRWWESQGNHPVYRIW